jgi:hypothetical protein
MEIYFIVLHLPGSEELKFVEGVSPENFWKTVSGTIANKTAKIVSVRPDTGVSEELRSHISRKKFETYFLFYMMLTREEAKSDSVILKKANDLLAIGNNEALIDADDNFQLVTLDYLDPTLTVNFGSGSPLLSA